MSTENDTLGGLTVKDLSLLIVVSAIAILFAVIAIGIALAIANDPSALVIGGELNPKLSFSFF